MVRNVAPPGPPSVAEHVRTMAATAGRVLVLVAVVAIMLGLPATPHSGAARAEPPAVAPDAAAVAASALTVRPAEDEASAPEGVALWRVGDADTTVWLFGTVHLLDPTLRWRRPAVDAALADADVVYLEADTSPQARARATPMITSLAFLPPGERLEATLSPEARVTLRQVAARLGQPMFILNRYRAWFASITLGVAWIQAEGGDPEAGADRVIEREAAAAGTPIRYLETVEEQVRILASLPDEVDRRVLEASLRQIDSDPDAIAIMFDAWSMGDADRLGAVMETSFADEPLVRQTYLIDRNTAWVEEIVRVIDAEPGVFFVAVGAGHLIGPGSVRALLEARGHAVTRH